MGLRISGLGATTQQAAAGGTYQYQSGVDNLIHHIQVKTLGTGAAGETTADGFILPVGTTYAILDGPEQGQVWQVISPGVWQPISIPSAAPAPPPITAPPSGTPGAVIPAAVSTSFLSQDSLGFGFSNLVYGAVLLGAVVLLKFKKG